MRNSLLLAAAVCALLAAGPSKAAGPVDRQSRQALAAGAYAEISCNGVALPPVYLGEVTGDTHAGAFQNSTEVGSFNKTWQLPGSSLEINLTATGVNTGVSGTPAPENAEGQIVASFSIASETVSLVAAGGSAAAPLFSVTVKNLYGNAGVLDNTDDVFSGTEYTNGASVTISGSLLGPRVITAPLAPPFYPRATIFRGGGAEVVLNVVNPYPGVQDGLPEEDVTAVQVGFFGIPSFNGCYGWINMGYAGINFPNF